MKPLQQGLQTAAPDYRDTVFLPKTDFPMKAGLAAQAAEPSGKALSAAAGVPTAAAAASMRSRDAVGSP